MNRGQSGFQKGQRRLRFRFRLRQGVGLIWGDDPVLDGLKGNYLSPISKITWPFFISLPSECRQRTPTFDSSAASILPTNALCISSEVSIAHPRLLTGVFGGSTFKGSNFDQWSSFFQPPPSSSLEILAPSCSCSEPESCSFFSTIIQKVFSGYFLAKVMRLTGGISIVLGSVSFLNSVAASSSCLNAKSVPACSIFMSAACFDNSARCCDFIWSSICSDRICSNSSPATPKITNISPVFSIHRLGALRLSLLQNSGAYSSIRPTTIAVIAQSSATFRADREDSSDAVSKIDNTLATYRKKEQWGFIAVAVALIAAALVKLFRR
jgi:hypothetical protein